MESPGTQPHKYFSFSRAVRSDAKANPGNQMCALAVPHTENRIHRGLSKQLSTMAKHWFEGRIGVLKLDRRSGLEAADRFSVFGSSSSDRCRE